MFYEANDARLYMGQSTADVLPEPDADEFVEVPLTGSITPPSNTLSTAFFNVTNDRNRRSLGGKPGDQTVEGNCVVDWDSPVHNAMFEDSKTSGGVKRNWYMEYAGDRRRLDFRAFVSSWAEEALEANDDASEHRANFTLSLDGEATATVTPAGP
jgi:hypothetical protein